MDPSGTSTTAQVPASTATPAATTAPAPRPLPTPVPNATPKAAVIVLHPIIETPIPPPVEFNYTTFVFGAVMLFGLIAGAIYRTKLKKKGERKDNSKCLN